MKCESKVSIITVCINEAARIRETAESVVGQTYRDFEWIVQDGGSTDGTLDILKEYMSSITVLLSEKDSGVYDAMNKGISRAKGEYCIFMNGGDYFYDHDVIKRFCRHKRISDICYGAISEIKSSGKERIKFDSEILDLRKHLYSRSLPHQGSFIRRALFDKYGLYNADFRIVADWEFFGRCIVGNKASVEHLPFPVAVYHFDGMSFMAKNSKELLRERHSYRAKTFGHFGMVKHWVNTRIGQVKSRFIS